jgi:antitoxin HicB
MRIDDKLQIPRPSKARRDQSVLSVPAQTAAKAALYLAMLSAGVGPRELARRMGCDPKEAMRLLDPRYPSKIGRLQEAIRLANGEVTLSFRHAS